jgi:hypothetical protein
VAFDPSSLSDRPRLALALLVAGGAAVAAGTLLPTPLPGPLPGALPSLFDRGRPPPASLPSFTVGTAPRASDAAALRRLIEQLRDQRRAQALAEALERLHGMTGEAEPLREALDLRRALGDLNGARALLERLALRGNASEAELLDAAAQRAAAGDPAGAAALLLRAITTMPTEGLALGVLQAALLLPDPMAPMRLLGVRLAERAPDLLEPVRRATLALARPRLALALMEGLPPALAEDPATIFRMAEAEARAGFPGAALARLLALRATEGLPPGAGALLVDLALREGRLEDAFAVAAQLPGESWPASLPLRLHEAARTARRPELFRAINPAMLAARPAAAAVLALAQGDRGAAQRFAEAALRAPPEDAAAARGLAAVLRELGIDSAAWARLRAALDGGGSPDPGALRQSPDPGALRQSPDPGALRLFAELSALPARAPLALPALERLRNEGAVAGEAWLRLTLAAGRRGGIALFLQTGGPATPAVLAEVLEFGVALRDAALAEAAGRALLRQPLPQGWTAEEVPVLASLAQPLTPGSLAAALDLLTTLEEAEARERLATRLAAAPDILGAATGLSNHPALAHLAAEARVPGEAAVARLALLAVLAPRNALPLLEARAEAQPARFGPALVLAMLRAGDVAGGQAALAALLPRLTRAGQADALFLLLASAPQAARPMLDQRAAVSLGQGWRRDYEAALERAGRVAELEAALSARAALPETSAAERAEIAARLARLRAGG